MQIFRIFRQICMLSIGRKLQTGSHPFSERFFFGVEVPFDELRVYLRFLRLLVENAVGVCRF